MNKIGRSNNQLATQLQQQQQQQLKKSVASAQTQNVQTLGRSLQQTKEDAKQGEELVTAPKERLLLTAPPAESEPTSEATSSNQSTSPQQARTLTLDAPDATGLESGTDAKVASDASSRSAEALSSFTDSLFGLQDGNKKEFESILTESAMLDTSGVVAPGQEREVSLAATALKTAVAKLEAKMPGATKEQIRQAAKTDPEVAKWAAIADTAGNYLNAINAEGTKPGASASVAGAPGSTQADGSASAGGGPVPPAAAGAPGTGQTNPDSPFRLDPVAQAQMMADNVKTSEEIAKIYQQMWAEVAKARAQRFQILLETMNAVNQVYLDLYISRQKSFQAHSKNVMSVILENYK